MPAHMPEFAPYPTFEEWLAKPVIQPLTSSETLGWEDILLNTSTIQATKEAIHGPLCENHSLIFQLHGSTRLQTDFDGKYWDEHLTAGVFGLVPAMYESYGRWSHSVSAAFVQISPRLITACADDALRGDPAHVQILPLIKFHDPLLHHLITELCGELQNPSPFGALFAESVAHTITLHLLRKYSNAVLKQQVPPTRLTSRQMRVIDDYLESHLDQKITLTDLATLLFMSVPHFERLFRESFGCAPYRYVLKRRIERAKRLLGNTGFSLHEVARQSGFANQSHLTKHFTKFVGYSPARYRESLRN